MAVDRGFLEVTKALLNPEKMAGEGERERFENAVRESVNILDNRGLVCLSLIFSFCIIFLYSVS